MTAKATIEVHLDLLGTRMKDVVTGFEGMVESVCFDTYGCVQACIKPKADKEGKVPDGYWFDIKRLKANGARLMAVPPHFTTPPGKERGPADKPPFSMLPKK